MGIVWLDEVAGEIERILARGADPRKITVTVLAEKEGFEIYCAKCEATRTSKISPSRYATKDGDRWKYDCKSCKDIERKIGKRKVVEPKQCRHCGATFQPKRSDGLYCTTRCKTAYGRRMAGVRDYMEFYLQSEKTPSNPKNLTDEELLVLYNEIPKPVATLNRAGINQKLVEKLADLKTKKQNDAKRN